METSLYDILSELFPTGALHTGNTGNTGMV